MVILIILCRCGGRDNTHNYVVMLVLGYVVVVDSFIAFVLPTFPCTMHNQIWQKFCSLVAYSIGHGGQQRYRWMLGVRFWGSWRCRGWRIRTSVGSLGQQNSSQKYCGHLWTTQLDCLQRCWNRWYGCNALRGWEHHVVQLVQSGTKQKTIEGESCRLFIDDDIKMIDGKYYEVVSNCFIFFEWSCVLWGRCCGELSTEGRLRRNATVRPHFSGGWIHWGTELGVGYHRMRYSYVALALKNRAIGKRDKNDRKRKKHTIFLSKKYQNDVWADMVAVKEWYSNFMMEWSLSGRYGGDCGELWDKRWWCE